MLLGSASSTLMSSQCPANVTVILPSFSHISVAGCQRAFVPAVSTSKRVGWCMQAPEACFALLLSFNDKQMYQSVILLIVLPMCYVWCVVCCCILPPDWSGACEGVIISWGRQCRRPLRHPSCRPKTAVVHNSRASSCLCSVTAVSS